MSIHPTALISPHAKLGADVSVGPFAVIEDGTEVGDRCVIESAAQIRSGTKLGPDCFVGSGALLGSDPHFVGFDRKVRSGVEIGPRNVLREYVTVHRSIYEGGHTNVGSDNFLMAGAHIGHDSVVGSHNVLANNVLLGGHVILGSHCFLGGGSAFHQFVRVGDYAMAQGHSGFSLDLPPYVIGADINVVVGINAIGLKRAGFSTGERKCIKEAFREVYHSSKTLQEVLAEADAGTKPDSLICFYDFLRAKSKKGLCIRSTRMRESS